MKAPGIVVFTILLGALAVTARAQSNRNLKACWNLKAGQSLRYEVEVRQASQPVKRMIVDLTWTVREAEGGRFRIRGSIDRVRADLKGGGTGFEIDTARESPAAAKAFAKLIEKRGAKRMPGVVGEQFTMVLAGDGITCEYQDIDRLKPLRAGLPEKNLLTLLETGVELPDGLADEWSFHVKEKQSDGSRKDVDRFSGRIVDRNGSRIRITYRAEPRRSPRSLRFLRQGLRKGYTRKGKAEFNLAKGYLIKLRETFKRKKVGRCTVLWRFVGEGRLVPPDAKSIPVVVVARPSGKPVAGARIVIGKELVRTDAEGRASVPEHERCFVVAARSLTTVEVTLPRPTPRRKPPFTIDLWPVAALEGRVTDVTGAPLAGVNAYVRAYGGETESRRMRTGVKIDFRARDFWEATTDASGGFRIAGLPAGITLDVMAYTSQQPRLGDLEVCLKAGETKEVVLEFPAHGKVRGRVTDARGKPIRGADVRLTRKRARSRMGDTRDNGSFEFDAVKIGKWTLTVTRDGGKEEPCTRVIEVREHGELVILKPIVLRPRKKKPG